MNTLILTFITTISLLIGSMNGTSVQKNNAINSAKKALIEIQKYQKDNTNIFGAISSSTPAIDIKKKTTTSTSPIVDNVTVYSLEPGYFGFDSAPVIVDMGNKKSVIYTIKITGADIEITLDGETKKATTNTVTFDNKTSGVYPYVVKVMKNNFYSVINGKLSIP